MKPARNRIAAYTVMLALGAAATRLSAQPSSDVQITLPSPAIAIQHDAAPVIPVTLTNATSSEATVACAPQSYLSVFVFDQAGNVLKPNLPLRIGIPVNCPGQQLAAGSSKTVDVSLPKFGYSLPAGVYRVRIAFGSYGDASGATSNYADEALTIDA